MVHKMHTTRKIRPRVESNLGLVDVTRKSVTIRLEVLLQ
jgi:hypothetical protein